MKRMIFSAALAVCCLAFCLFFVSCDGERITTDDGTDSTTVLVDVSSTSDESSTPADDTSSTPTDGTSSAPDETTAGTPTTDTGFDTSFPNTPEDDGTKRY